MAIRPSIPNPGPSQSHSDRTREAWRLHRDLMLLQRHDPALADDELFRVFCAEAYARFEQAMEGRR